MTNDGGSYGFLVFRLESVSIFRNSGLGIEIHQKGDPNGKGSLKDLNRNARDG